ncbi:MAG TPA: helix-turn-helix transcriptional regulator [Streptosporangiaceae bacterium]|jgi:transcriptional regulator with XRE-family HTH domain|nr:helix-turn-helix transcriptional regulator [Streptosporangiaceae bacterium]
MSAPRPSARAVGDLLREWRQRRRLSQLDLAIAAEISARHLSFVETGRSRPTSGMILRLSEHLDVPLRDRNALLLAGGYAPAYPEHGLDEPELAAVRAALRRVLDSPAPYPAVVVNRWWELIDASAGVALLTAGAAPELLEPPVNVLRLSLHPDGMAPRIINLAQWRAHLLTRLGQQVHSTGDPRLAELHAELLGYPGGQDSPPAAAGIVAPQVVAPQVVAPLRYRHGEQELSFFSMTTVIGTPMDVTVAELAIESFYPADEPTAVSFATGALTRAC